MMPWSWWDRGRGAGETQEGGDIYISLKPIHVVV